MSHEINERVELTTSIEIVGVAKENAIKTKAMPKDDLQYGEVDVIVSNSGEDRHGEKILMQGIDTTQIKRNPTVLWAHEYSDLPIGKITKLWKDGENLVARIHFAYEEYKFANDVYKMVVGGYINAVSIGGIVREWDDKDFSIIKKLEMIELSVVPVGAHPDALVIGKAFKDVGVKKSIAMKRYASFAGKAKAFDKIKKLTENNANKYISVLKELVSMLESVENQDPIEGNDTKAEEAKKVILIKV